MEFNLFKAIFFDVFIAGLLTSLVLILYSAVYFYYEKQIVGFKKWKRQKETLEDIRDKLLAAENPDFDEIHKADSDLAVHLFFRPKLSCTLFWLR